MLRASMARITSDINKFSICIIYRNNQQEYPTIEAAFLISGSHHYCVQSSSLSF